MKNINAITSNGTPVELAVESVGSSRTAVNFKGERYILPMNIKDIQKLLTGCNNLDNVEKILQATTVE